jgi:hypothetical protein
MNIIFSHFKQHNGCAKKSLSNLFHSSRVWQMRRIVITKEEISFAFVGEEAQIDYIPFAEVTYVKEMTDAAGEDHDDEASKKFSYAMQIATKDDGFNSGRIYYLSTESKEKLDDLISDLSYKAKIARVHAEARTSFRRFQLRVRKRYESRKFQFFMALLILAVGRLTFPSLLSSTIRKIVRRRTSGAPSSSRNSSPCSLTTAH